MGQGALNYQGVKGGLKLNNVTEELKSIYQEQQIEAGDFINYTSEGEVKLALQSPFDGIALTSGVSGQQIKIAKPIAQEVK
jgi:hypothetical protein